MIEKILAFLLWLFQPKAPSAAPPDLVTIILAFNNGQLIFKIMATFSNPNSGSTIHKITEAQADAIAPVLRAAAQVHGLPLTYALACLAIESLLDPNAENKNLRGSNPTNDPLGYDVGIAQIKLRYLAAPDPRAYALDITRAIPHFCALMATNIELAKGMIAKRPSPDARMNKPLILATCIYNFGPAGVQDMYAKGEFPNHAQHVLDYEHLFSKQLNVAPCL